MISRLDYLRERLSTSIWPVPVALSLLYGILAPTMLWLDRYLAAHPLVRPDFLFELDAARQTLTIIAGSTIGVAGVAFSISMVAMTLTSAQYGPKLLRNFLEDRTSKLTLGQFLGTYVFALVALIGFAPDDVPRFTPLLGLLLALSALTGFVSFIHRISTDLQADQIVQQIGERMQDSLLSYATDGAPRITDTLTWRRHARHRHCHPIKSDLRGYVQSIDYAGLTAWCTDNDCCLLVQVRAGDFLVDGLCLLKLYTSEPMLRDGTAGSLLDCIVVGPVRTPLQDTEYSITQLNQLAGRALSPGINDPGTAITCIDWFSLALSEIIDRDLPGCVYVDDAGRARLLVRMTHLEGIMKATYAPLRQLSRSDVSVTVRLFESLCRLAVLTQRPDRLSILRRHGELIRQCFDGSEHADDDIGDIHQRHRRLIARTTATTQVA